MPRHETEETNRPDPDSLLDLLSNDRSVSARGRLKLFFGSSAGVGKTFAMLAEARRILASGLDVVIGVVETHGREETAALLEGMPYIPRRESGYRGVTLLEFDLEAALERKPSLILMDELAHSNAPGSRHPKRWQDVEELLDQGIDVYTTLNVQHLESINDMVTRLTGVVVRETVPDSIFDEADEIALIDIPSDELLKRLHEGKVYIADGANKRAAENFFKKPNLIVLREMALRRMAERVDAEGDLLTAAAGQREAQLGQKILVCIGHDTLSARVIRHAKRMAARAKAPWFAIYVETGRHERLTEKARLTADRNLRLAEKMGAQILRLPGNDAADEILNHAASHGFTRIVVGHRHRPWAKRWLQGSLAAELIDKGAGFEVTTVTEERSPAGNAYTSFWHYHFARPSSYVLAMGILAIATLIVLPFRDITDADNLTMIYLTSVVIIAAWLGTGPSVMASLLSVAVFNFFFTDPFYTFSFINPGYYYTFSVMLITSLIIGSLTAKLSLQARQSRKRESETGSLYALARELSSARGIEKIIAASLKHVRDASGMDAVIFWMKDKQLQIVPDDSPACELKEESVARWVMQNGQIAGRDTNTLPSARGLYAPMNTEGETLGVLGLIPPQEGYAFSSAQVNQLETLASVIASAFGRVYRAEEAERARIESESEKLRNVLLSSVSHDLRTPLASISGISSSLLLSGIELSSHVADGLRSIHDQSSKLAKTVTNLLDVSSLESGRINLNRQPYFLEEVIGSALLRLDGILQHCEVNTQLGKEQLIHMDGLLVEQVFINLLENAAKYAGEKPRISIRVKDQEEFVQITVSDNGQGIPKEDIAHVFEKFYKGAQGGLGLGLPICRAIIEVHGGRMWVENNPVGGVDFHFTLPKTRHEAGMI